MAATGPANTTTGSNRLQRAVITNDDRHTASLLGGHTWNILNHREEHYLRHCRSNEHYVDEQGRTTHHWMAQKRHIDSDGDGAIDSFDSSHVQEALRCPATAGKEHAHTRSRQMKQLCQMSAPVNYGQYSARRTESGAPPTPGRAGDLGRQVLSHKTRRDPAPGPPPPRVLDRADWTPRRGEVPTPRLAPPEHEVYRDVHQLRAESHMDVTDANFADALHSARRRSGANGLVAAGALSARPPSSARSSKPPALFGGALTARSSLAAHEPPRALGQGAFHSSERIPEMNVREVTNELKVLEKDKMRRFDPFHARPMQQSGSSAVKYDILTNETKPFWY